MDISSINDALIYIIPIGIAERTLDIYTAAVLAEKFVTHVDPKPHWRTRMDALSESSCASYRAAITVSEAQCSVVEWWEKGKNNCNVQYAAWLRKLLTIILLHPPHFLFHPFIRHAANSAMSCFFSLTLALLTLVKKLIPTSSHSPFPPLLSHPLRRQIPLLLTNPSPPSPPLNTSHPYAGGALRQVLQSSHTWTGTGESEYRQQVHIRHLQQLRQSVLHACSASRS